MRVREAGLPTDLPLPIQTVGVPRRTGQGEVFGRRQGGYSSPGGLPGEWLARDLFLWTVSRCHAQTLPLNVYNVLSQHQLWMREVIMDKLQ